MTDERNPREKTARIAGVALALVAMTTASLTVGWPAIGISAALGYGVYLLVRGKREQAH